MCKTAVDIAYVPGVEVNALMRTFNMKSLLFPIDTPASVASEALAKSKEAGALAAFDRIPFSYVSANFTFNTDNSVVDLYGIRASLVDGGEIRGAGTAWISPEVLFGGRLLSGIDNYVNGKEDDTAIDVNFSGRTLHAETKLSGSLLRPRFDIKWTAPTAEGSFSGARGDIIISHDFITVNSASAALDLYMKARTSYSDDFSLEREEFHAPRAIPFTVDGVEFDLHMRGFEFFSLVTTYTLDFPRPLLLKATGRIKFQGKVLEPSCTMMERNFDKNRQLLQMLEKGSADSLVGELDASGRPDESLAVEFVGPLQPSGEDGVKSGQLFSISLQKGQLRANVGFQQCHSASLEIWHFPLDELELASLRGTIQRAEIQLNLQKRKGHGILSVLQPKFSGILGEALDVAARWSGDVVSTLRSSFTFAPEFQIQLISILGINYEVCLA
ncbi:hypothetical protein SESBI_14613 [Sesbania bispinosa]|nr:hypothetical protein SESBI_14613 [Sesbania bispinosa]